MAKQTLDAQLHEAECALACSIKALSSHGHQGITWALYRYDAQRVRELETKIAKRDSGK